MPMEYNLIQTEYKDLTVIEQILTNRGINLEDIPHYLNTTDEDNLYPGLIKNIAEGAQMLVKHIVANDKIFIQVDSDCDGYTSAAALINYLNCICPFFSRQRVLYRIHAGKQHGILPETIPEGVKLVIAPDSSSNDYEQHLELKNRGIDVLVIDHHEADRESENACVINNQLCDYPTKSLSGVGMVYKLCQYIDLLLGANHADQFLDLVSLGMIADMMDLRDFETKHLIQKGLTQIHNPFFRKMVEKQSYSLGNELTPIGVAFYIAPYVNAMIRMGTQKEKMVLFESMLNFKAYELINSTKRGCIGQQETRVEQACRTCTNVKNRQTKARDNALTAIEEQIKEENLLEHKLLIVKLEPSMAVDKNLTGLIANQLMSKYQQPTILLNKVIHEDGSITWEGSGRGYDKSSFKDLRKFLNDSQYCLYAQGHANAMGVGVNDADLPSLIQYADIELEDCNFTPCYNVDFIFSADNMNSADIIEIADLKSLWGQNIDEPYVAIENVKVANIVLMAEEKNPTIKITLPNGISLIKFKSSRKEYEKLKSENEYSCLTINVVGRCEKNVWNGRISAQILIEDYDIVNSGNWYF